MNMFKVEYFGVSGFYIDNEALQLPYTKAYMVLYYILIEKFVSRDLVASIIWPDMDEHSAKKNLRNALYVIRQKTYNDLIISEKNSTLRLNDRYKIISDYEYIKNYEISSNITEGEAKKYIESYNGTFLEDLVLESSENYKDWIDDKAFEIRNIYLFKLKELKDILKYKGWKEILQICIYKIIKIEEYDEESYRDLMDVYIEDRKYSKALDIYIKLSKKLYEDLSVQPSLETKQYYQKLMIYLNNIKDDKPLYYGRTEELNTIKNNIFSFISGDLNSSILIKGESGIGKSYMLDRIEDYISSYDHECIVVRLDNQDYEMKLIFKFWEELFLKVSNYIKEKNIKFIEDGVIDKITDKFVNSEGQDLFLEMSIYEMMTYDMIERTVYDLILKLSREKKIILLLDDMEYIDNLSIDILFNILLKDSSNTLIIGTYADTSITKNKYYQNLCKKKIVKELELNRFDILETKTIIENILPEFTNYYKEIYEQSGGNPFYINKILELLKIEGTDDMKKNLEIIASNNIEENIKNSIDNLDKVERNVVDICGIFRSKIPLKILRDILSMEDINLIILLDDLIHHNILKEEEVENEDLYLVFTNIDIKNYVYNDMDKFKKIILHEKLGEYYTDILSFSTKNYFEIYTDIIYHYQKSKNHHLEYKYRILRLENVLRSPAEIFPEVEDLGEEKTFIYVIDKVVIDNEFKKIDNLLNAHITLDTDKILEERIKHMYIYGTYLKTKGRIEEGNDWIKNMIPIAKSKKMYSYVFKAYCQFIDVSIFSKDYINLEKYIEDLREIVDKMDGAFEKAYLNRITGYYEVIKGNYEKARDYQYKSIEIIESSLESRKYVLGVVAAMSNIAESYMDEGYYDKAEEYYLNACDKLPRNYENIPGAALMYGKMGKIKFKKNEYKESYYFYKKALKAYEENNFKWNISEVYYYLFELEKILELEEGKHLYLDKMIENLDTCNNEDIINKYKK